MTLPSLNSPCPFSITTLGDKIPPASLAQFAPDHNENKAATGTAIVGSGDTKAVAVVRFLVLIVLVVSMTCTATAVYIVTRTAEHDLFRASFTSDAADVMESVGETLYTSLGAVDSYLVSLVSLARATNQSWPFVSVPDASVRLAKLRSLSKAVSVQQAHFVTAEQTVAWDEYTKENNQWATDALSIQKTDPNYHGIPAESFEHKPGIRSYKGNSTGPGPFLPTWHSSPFVPAVSSYNNDGMAYTHVVEMLPELLGSPHRAVIGRANNIVNASDPVTVAQVEASHAYWRKVIHPNDDPTEPISWIFFPIVDDMANQVALDETSERSNRTVVGVFSMFIFWRDLIRNVLPIDTNGTVVVFRNGCDQVFSFEINGPTTSYLGPRDAHDESFTTMGVSIGFDQLVDVSTTGRQYTGSPLGGERCPYTLHVYPSQRRRDDFVTARPAQLAAAVVAIFVFTSAIFVLYDTCVERRQRKVVYTAMQSNINVAVLERMVADRTKSLADANVKLEEANRRVTKASAAQLEHFACMSHEIRTPLNCIIGLSSLLLDSKLEPMQEEYVRLIVSSGDLLLTVVNDVLDYAKLETGNVDIVPVRSNLQHTLSAVVQAIETKAASKELTIRTEYDPLVGEFIHMDCRRLQQILYNLLGNAVKFSHPGGTIHFSVSLLVGKDAEAALLDQAASIYCCDEEFRSEAVVVSETPNAAARESKSFSTTTTSTSDGSFCGSMIRFIVKDFGSGIERKDFAAIFQPFRQASAETERVYGWTGLGLAVTSRLVANMGGRISVDSQVGEWSEFTVDLPYTDSPVDVDQLTSQLMLTRFILVEDDSATVGDMSRLFRQLRLDFCCYRSMNEMISSVEMLGGTPLDHSDVYMVNEKLFDSAAYQLLPSTRPVLLTHGPQYTVRESVGHYRSLTNVLPSLLLESILSSLTTTVNQNPVKGVTNTKRPTTNPGETVRILIAEDNKVNQTVLLKLLDRLGFTKVDVVADGRQACDRLVQERYDIVLMDVQMPTLNGMDACQEIQSRTSVYPKPNVIFITAHASDAHEAACRNAGGIDFLAKPINLRDLDDCMQRNVPVQDFLVPPPTAELPLSGETLPKPRILVAEDNKINQKVLLRILNKLGYEAVDVMDDGQQACDRELEHAYDLILMDIQMPIKDGISACREILGRPSNHPKPKVVFVTAHVSDEYETECRAAGGVDFLTKPINMALIENCLKCHAATMTGKLSS